MWGVLLNVHDGGSVAKRLVFEEITQCNVTFNNLFTNADGEPFMGSYKIEKEKKLECDKEKFAEASETALEIINGMQFQETNDALHLSHAKVYFDKDFSRNISEAFSHRFLDKILYFLHL